MSDESTQELLEGSIAGGKWTYRTGETPGTVVLATDGGAEQSLELTGGVILEVRDLKNAAQELMIRTERFEHTLVPNPKGDSWRIMMTKREA